MSVKLPRWTPVSSAYAEILTKKPLVVSWPLKLSLLIMAMLNRSAMTAKMSGDRGHPCRVPELMGKSDIETSPFTRTLALTLSSL